MLPPAYTMVKAAMVAALYEDVRNRAAPETQSDQDTQKSGKSFSFLPSEFTSLNLVRWRRRTRDSPIRHVLDVSWWLLI